ncbi:CCAAT/enhancer-binding protein zeta [Halotydeus destructor]|nr:CCAAT/enhancer-binding protein zeta [Halotydeus destructor]
MKIKNNSQSLLIKPGLKWWEHVEDLSPESGANTESIRCPRDKELEWRREAESLLEEDKKRYTSQQGKNQATKKRTDFNWIRTVVLKGALSDKIAAHTLLIEDSSVHNLNSVLALVQLVHSKGKREQVLSMDHMKDIFVHDLLHPKRKLKPFAESVVNLDDITDPKKRSIKLLVSYYEDQIRHQYRSFCEGVEKISHDVVPATKSKSINVLYELLSSNSENERYLLEKIVNKLGDPSNKVASHVAHVLKQLVTDNHPAMKPVVVDEVERLMYRPHVTPKAQYYCMCFLQEVVFRQVADAELANKLVKLYFGFFKTSTTKGEVDNKMMAALLTALSRALPYSTLGQNVLSEHMETFYKLIHFVNTNIVIQGLVLMYKVLEGGSNGALADRYYSVLFRSLLSPDLEICSKLPMFLNLVYRVVKNDTNRRRVLSFVKRLLQIALDASPHLSASIAIVVSELIRNKSEVADFIKADGTTPADDDASDLEGEDGGKKEKDYQLNARDPRFSQANKTSPWELLYLQRHYHPSVSLFASNISQKKGTQYDGDPLTDFTLKHFLERFVFRNPKHISSEESAHARQSTLFGRLKSRNQLRRDVFADRKNLVNVSESSVPLEERFIFKYLKDKRLNGLDENVDELESVASDEFEQLLDRYEKDFDDDFDMAEDYKKGKEQLKREMEDDDGDEEGSFMGSDDEDMNFDDNDEYRDAFGGLDEEFGQDEEDGDDLEDNILEKHVRRGRDKSTASLFASADEFAHILEGDDGEFSDDDKANESGSDAGDDVKSKPVKSKAGMKKNYAKSSKRPSSSKKFSKAKRFRSK